MTVDLGEYRRISEKDLLARASIDTLLSTSKRPLSASSGRSDSKPSRRLSLSLGGSRRNSRAIRGTTLWSAEKVLNYISHSASEWSRDTVLTLLRLLPDLPPNLSVPRDLSQSLARILHCHLHTPTPTASYDDHTILLFFSKGARDPDDSSAECVLHWAASADRWSLFPLLQPFGHRCERCDYHGRTVLHFALGQQQEALESALRASPPKVIKAVIRHLICQGDPAVDILPLAAVVEYCQREGVALANEFAQAVYKEYRWMLVQWMFAHGLHRSCEADLRYGGLKIILEVAATDCPITAEVVPRLYELTTRRPKAPESDYTTYLTTAWGDQYLRADFSPPHRPIATWKPLLSFSLSSRPSPRKSLSLKLLSTSSPCFLHNSFLTLLRIGDFELARHLFHLSTTYFIPLHDDHQDMWGEQQGTLESPLHAVVKEGDIENVRRLLDWGLKPNAADRYRATPLHYAARALRGQIVECLCEAQADVGRRDVRGETALHWAGRGYGARAKEEGEGAIGLREKYEEVVECLMTWGADPDARDWGRRRAVGVDPEEEEG